MLTPLPPPPEPIRKITYYDKGAHLVFFGVLNYLLMAIGLKIRRFRFSTIAIISTLVSLFVAMTAEYLQKFIPGREESFFDLMAGVLGMLLAMPVSYILNYHPKKKIMLHVCCAPCSTSVREALSEDYDIEFFFFNPNIYPKKEYEKRLDEVKKLARRFGIKVREGNTNHRSWLKAIKGGENDPEGGGRCEKCFLYRLKETSKISKKNGFSLFTTTLSVSPHKNAEHINRSGREAGESFEVEFLESDFKKNDGFKKSIELSKKMGLYRQKYCGCEFSMQKKPKI